MLLMWTRTRTIGRCASVEIFAESYANYASARITYLAGISPDHLVSRLHLVAITGDALVVVCEALKVGGSCLAGPESGMSRSTTSLAAKSWKRQEAAPKPCPRTSTKKTLCTRRGAPRGSYGLARTAGLNRFEHCRQALLCRGQSTSFSGGRPCGRPP